MGDFKVVLPTTTEEWQRDMNIAYNKALDDLLNRIDLMFLYKDTKGVFHSASYANLNRKSIHAVVEQLKK